VVANTKSTRWTLLAFTRFVLAWIVMASHAYFLDVTHATPWTYFWASFGAQSAVYGFLVISGYSIAASIERSEAGFYARRFWRIYPVYCVSLLVAVGVGLCIPGGFITDGGFAIGPVTPVPVLATLAMLQTVIAPTIAPDGQLWSIGVEWWNYMLAPLYRKMSTPWLGLIILISMTALVFLKMPDAPGVSLYGHMFVVVTWFWVLGFVYHRHRRTLFGLVILVAPVLLFAGLDDFGRAGALGVLGVLLCEDVKVPDRLARVMEWLGDVSYPLYAIHLPILIVFLRFRLSYPFGAIACSLLLSAAILHLVDLPLRRWRAGYPANQATGPLAMPESAVP
jgi:peptidoglycan/LPS O-acetylase OafA/YrhL